MVPSLVDPVLCYFFSAVFGFMVTSLQGCFVYLGDMVYLFYSYQLWVSSPDMWWFNFGYFWASHSLPVSALWGADLCSCYLYLYYSAQLQSFLVKVHMINVSDMLGSFRKSILSCYILQVGSYFLDAHLTLSISGLTTNSLDTLSIVPNVAWVGTLACSFLCIPCGLELFGSQVYPSMSATWNIFDPSHTIIITYPLFDNCYYWLLFISQITLLFWSFLTMQAASTNICNDSFCSMLVCSGHLYYWHLASFFGSKIGLNEILLVFLFWLSLFCSFSMLLGISVNDSASNHWLLGFILISFVAHSSISELEIPFKDFVTFFCINT